MRVLFVEDAADFARTTTTLLQRAGCVVTWVTTGAEALQCVARRPFDVMISALEIGDADGLALMTKLQSRCPCPAIALSDDFLPGQIERVKRAGFADFARRPVDCDTLMRLIRHLVGPVKAREKGIAASASELLAMTFTRQFIATARSA